MDQQEILEKIEIWYEQDEHQKIVDLILSLPEKDQTPILLSEVGRAYNNLYWQNPEKNGNLPLLKAKEVLENLRDDLIDDYKWHYRIAYTYFYLEDADSAEFHFKESERLGTDKHSMYLDAIDLSKEKGISLADALDEVWEMDGVFDGPMAYYTADEMEHLENFIDTNYGKIDGVFHEIVSPDIHCDIYIIKPTPERNYYTLITGGMGAYEMNVPEGFESYKRAELMINLPPDWDINSEDESLSWPIQWLKVLARLPINQNTFLGWGHTVPTGAPLEGTHFDCFILLGTQNKAGEDAYLELENGETITFYTIFPLYPEETMYKLDHDAEALLEKFDDAGLPYPPIVQIDRPNTCIGYEVKPNEYLLNQIHWIFTPNMYNSLMNFVVDVKTYNQEIDNDLADFNPFATIFTSDKVKLMYEAFIQSKDDLLETETLLMEEEVFAQQPQDGYYYAKILAELNSGQDHIFSSLNLLLQVQNTLANKELGDYIHFQGLEIQGYEENGTPVVYLLLGN
ncbi:hypothetical protein GO491_05085 [Flavobacteriaceae bacterium Ap0902]|nr:hypothetical protein [Flavobacteriaceae bacterium Ap0902]